jgi:uncharacterized protein YcfL
MKKSLLLSGVAFMAVLMLASCGSHKNAVVESKIEKDRSLEGEKVVVETTKLYGTEMVESLNEDGTKMVKVPYKWYAGIGKANDKQTAIEMAELEARATISRIIENAVLAESERGTVANNGDVQKALTSHWKQVSTSIQNACEPIGDTRIEYSPSSKMYTVTAKVGIKGERFQQLLNSAGNFKPSNLSGDDLQQFIETNKSIMNAAKGN